MSDPKDTKDLVVDGSKDNAAIMDLLKQPNHFLVDRGFVKIDAVSYHMEDVCESSDGRFQVLKLHSIRTEQDQKDLDFTYSTVLDRISQAPRTTIKLGVLERTIPIMKSADERKAAIKLHGELLEQYVSECKVKFKDL